MKQIGLVVLGFLIGIFTMMFGSQETAQLAGYDDSSASPEAGVVHQPSIAVQSNSAAAQSAVNDEVTDDLYPGDDGAQRAALAQDEGFRQVAVPELTDLLPGDSASATSLPEQYLSLLQEPQGPRRMTPKENQEFFDTDSRDEQWAYTMETGMTDYFARNLADDGMLIEHLECRGRMCQIAGIVYPGFDDTISNHLDQMRQSGWWQLSQSQHTVGTGGADGGYRFVTFVPRSDEDTIVPASIDCACE